MDVSILNIKKDLEQNYLKNSGGIITGDLTVEGNINGNARSASKLESTRTISLTGDITGSTSFDGSSDVSIKTTANCIKKGDIAIISGTMTVDANPDENVQKDPMEAKMTTITLNIPDGFGKDTCVPISIGFRRTDSRGYVYGWNNYPDSADSLTANMPHRLVVNDDNLSLVVGNFGQNSGNIQYKIVLMKLP